MRCIRQVAPWADATERRRLDTTFSTLKLEHRVHPDAIRDDPEAGRRARAFVAYEDALEATGGLDFDDLVARALGLLQADPSILATWRTACRELLVDEVQDVDRSQLELALQLAAPDHRIFLVGDDDQSIYGWRLADVRRVLDLAGRLPGLRRTDLVTNFRCPAPVVERAVRLVEHNVERFAKRISARPGAVGRIVLAPDGADDDDRVRHVLAAWTAAGDPDGSTQAILARTNRELLPAAAVALEAGIPFRAERLDLPLDDPRLEAILADLANGDPGEAPLLRLGRLRSRLAAAPPIRPRRTRPRPWRSTAASPSTGRRRRWMDRPTRSRSATSSLPSWPGPRATATWPRSSRPSAIDGPDSRRCVAQTRH